MLEFIAGVFIGVILMGFNICFCFILNRKGIIQEIDTAVKLNINSKSEMINPKTKEQEAQEELEKIHLEGINLKDLI